MEVNMPDQSERILRLPEVVTRIGLSRATIYKRIKEGGFPRQVHLGLRSAGWLESEIDNWIAKRVDARRTG
jgi:prophage regulatory protein